MKKFSRSQVALSERFAPSSKCHLARLVSKLVLEKRIFRLVSLRAPDSVTRATIDLFQIPHLNAKLFTQDFNILLDDVSITHLNFSPEYEKAVESKQVAQQQAERAKYFK